MIRVQAWKELVSPKFYGPLTIWPWLRISPQSSLNVIYYLIISAWQWLMSFKYMPCIPMQIKPNKSPLRNRFLVLLLWEIGQLSSPSRSCLGRLILIAADGGALQAKLPRSCSLCSSEDRLGVSPVHRGKWAPLPPNSQPSSPQSPSCFKMLKWIRIFGVIPTLL